jgi:short-subunit dehydrogenase
MAGFAGRTALVTGASSGIGAALARDLAARGAKVIVVARRADKLAAVAAEINGIAAPCDLTNELERKALAAAYPEVDILVNNAGLGLYGLFALSKWPEVENMLAVNITALTHLTHLFAQNMVTRRYGRVLNVGSTASFSPVPLFAAYAASKAYVLSLSEALDVELKPHNVLVTALCPGGTKSEFFTVSGFEETKAPGGGIMTSEAVAKIGLDALEAGRSSVVAGGVNALLAFATRLGPRWLNAAVGYKLMK